MRHQSITMHHAHTHYYIHSARGNFRVANPPIDMFLGGLKETHMDTFKSPQKQYSNQEPWICEAKNTNRRTLAILYSPYTLLHCCSAISGLAVMESRRINS